MVPPAPTGQQLTQVAVERVAAAQAMMAQANMEAAQHSAAVSRASLGAAQAGGAGLGANGVPMASVGAPGQWDANTTWELKRHLQTQQLLLKQAASEYAPACPPGIHPLAATSNWQNGFPASGLPHGVVPGGLALANLPPTSMA
eukprot:4560464-Prymnesium_polylepis.1